MSRQLRRVLPGILLILLVVMVAPVPAWAHGEAGYRDGVLEIVLTQWSLGFEVIEVPAGALTVHVVNEGSLHHNVKLSFEQNGETMGFETPLLAPGEHHTVEVQLPPGEYELYCSVPGHRELGMMAVLRAI